jgi:hypothetical protein
MQTQPPPRSRLAATRPAPDERPLVPVADGQLFIPSMLGRGRRLNIVVKSLFLTALVAAVLLHGVLPQLEGKAMPGRAVLFWMTAALVPITWRMLGRPTPYPHLVDTLVVVPFLGDIMSNFLRLYSSVSWWDSFGHFANWVLLCSAAGLLLLTLPLARANVLALVIGFGAFTHVMWELAEWGALLVGARKLGLTHQDTMTDFCFGMTGTLVAAIIISTVCWDRAMAERHAAGLATHRAH